MLPVLLLALALNSTAAPPQAATADERRSLSRISGIDVAVELTGNDAATNGLSKDQLKKDAELRLSSAGIKVGAKFEPYLVIGVVYLTDKARNGTDLAYAASVTVSFKQPVTLIRNNGLPAWARTWHNEMLISGPPAEGKERVQQTVCDLLDMFINDYLTVNPKR